MGVRKRSVWAGGTDYTGVSLNVIISHIRDWRDETAQSIKALTELQGEVERHRDQLEWPDEIVDYVTYFLDLLGRYLGDFDRLLVDLPRFVSKAHVEIVQQIYKSASHEENRCLRFREDHINRTMKNDGMRWLLDKIYGQSKSMLIDYKDLSNLVPRLRTFVGTTPKLEREREQKFGILLSAAQEQLDFDLWAAEGAAVDGYSIGVIFVDIDNFKRLNSVLTESVVDQIILRPFQQLVRDAALHRGGAYRHGGEEILIMLPNSDVDETARFAEMLRTRIETQKFAVEGSEPIQLTVSSGVAAWPLHGNTLTEVLHAANKAEHIAKEAGKNRIHVASG